MDESYCHERHVSEFSFLPSDAIGKPLVDVQASNGKRTEDLHDRGDRSTAMSFRYPVGHPKAGQPVIDCAWIVQLVTILTQMVASWN